MGKKIKDRKMKALEKEEEREREREKSKQSLAQPTISEDVIVIT